jgi:Tol biopolymer transport system component
MRKPLRARFIASEAHALLFLTMWGLFLAFSRPLMDGPAALPFFVLFFADLPISFPAFAAMFVSAERGMIAAVFWGVLGTLWWFLIGFAIDTRLRNYGKKRDELAAKSATGERLEQLPTAAVDDLGVGSHWRELNIAVIAVSALVLSGLVWQWNGRQGQVETGGIGDITFTPDGRSVLLSRSHGDSSLLYKVSLDSGKSVRVGKAVSGVESSASYSPDGRQIAFLYAAKKDERSHIFIMDDDGSNVHPLFYSSVETDDFSPRFAPDGKAIYFARKGSVESVLAVAPSVSGRWDIYSADLDGHNVRPLTNRQFPEFSEPSFSRDGNKMFLSIPMEDSGRLHLYSLDEPTKPETVLQLHVPNEPRLPIFSNASLAPDGRSIYFLAATDGAKTFNYDVNRLDLASNAVEKLTTANGYASDLCVSADGKNAVFLRWTSRWGSTPSISKMYLLDLTTKRRTPLNITGTR